MRHATIAISTCSPLLFQGLCSILRHVRDCNVRFEQIAPAELDADPSLADDADILFIDPFVAARPSISGIRGGGVSPRVIIVHASAIPADFARTFDGSISLYDSERAILSTVSAVLDLDNDADNRSELTPREKEIILGVVKGLSNKEIASAMNLSTNTVMTHRRNIAAKLQIHSPAGLTIYALVSRLATLEEIAADVRP